MFDNCYTFYLISTKFFNVILFLISFSAGLFICCASVAWLGPVFPLLCSPRKYEYSCFREALISLLREQNRLLVPVHLEVVTPRLFLNYLCNLRISFSTCLLAYCLLGRFVSQRSLGVCCAWCSFSAGHKICLLF